MKWTKYLFPLVKELPIFEYKGVNVNSYSSIECEDGILDNLSDSSRNVWTPLKFKEDSNLNLFLNLYLPILIDFVVGPKNKVVPYVSDYRPTKFGEFWASRR
jgi:hypothetical protein